MYGSLVWGGSEYLGSGGKPLGTEYTACLLASLPSPSPFPFLLQLSFAFLHVSARQIKLANAERLFFFSFRSVLI